MSTWIFSWPEQITVDALSGQSQAHHIRLSASSHFRIKHLHGYGPGLLLNLKSGYTLPTVVGA